MESVPVLLNPCVLEILFPYVGVEDLKNCRLVCSVWNKDATPMLKAKAMIYFDGHYDEEDPPGPDEEQDEHRDVIQYLRNMSHFRCESYCLSRGAKYTECQRELTKFFTLCGPEIKHLRIDYEYHSHFKVALIREILIKYLTNLEHLDIRNIPVVNGQMTKHQELVMVSNDVTGHRVSDELPVFWPRQPYKQFQNIKRIDLWNYNAYVGNLGRNFVEDLFEIAPNVEAIQVVDRYYSNIITYVLEGIRNKPARGLKIRELIFDSAASPTYEDIKMLAELNLNLKVLKLGTLPEMDDATAFQKLLNKQCSTLKELQFGNSFADVSIRVSLPIFPKLKRLELTQDVTKAQRFNIVFDPVNYELNFPVLVDLLNCRSRVFYQYDDCISDNICQRSKYEGKHFFRGMTALWQSLFPANGQVCKSLRVLDIPYPKEPSSLVKRLAVMFPSVSNPNLNAARVASG